MYLAANFHKSLTLISALVIPRLHLKHNNCSIHVLDDWNNLCSLNLLSVLHVQYSRELFYDPYLCRSYQDLTTSWQSKIENSSRTKSKCMWPFYIETKWTLFVKVYVNLGLSATQPVMLVFFRTMIVFDLTENFLL